MFTFRNSFFHRHLDRKLGAAVMANCGDRLVVANEIPPKRPAAAPRGDQQPVGTAEAALAHEFERHAFPVPEWQRPIDLGPGFGRAIPDAFFASDDPDSRGVCVYVDGLSANLHGDPQRRQRDQQHRAVLRSRDYQVHEIAASELFDADAVRAFLARVARDVLGRDAAKRIRSAPIAVAANTGSQAPGGKSAPFDVSELLGELHRAGISDPNEIAGAVASSAQPQTYPVPVLLWRRDLGSVALVCDGEAEPPAGPYAEVLRMHRGPVPAEVIERLRRFVRGQK